SCSHGAGRTMSRTKAKKIFTIEDQIKATAHVECRKDADVIDEIPMAYKDIDQVMDAQRELVEGVHSLRQVVCVKGCGRGAPRPVQGMKEMSPTEGHPRSDAMRARVLEERERVARGRDVKLLY